MTLSQQRSVAQFPHGDAFSPLALILLLAAPTKQILLSEQASGLEMATFIDDRACSCSGPAQAARVVSAWKDWGSGFGMLQNLDKIRVVAHAHLHSGKACGGRAMLPNAWWIQREC